MHRQHDRRPLIVCLVSLMELDRAVRGVIEERHHAALWCFRCSRSNDQWKVSPSGSESYVLGGSTGEHWSFYDSDSCTHIEVRGHAGFYRVCDYGGARDLVVSFQGHTATLCDPTSGQSHRFRVET